MRTPDGVESPYLWKALESLAGAQAEYANARFNNCANRCYYACFQAAIPALEQANIRARGRQGQWGHDFVQAEFIGQLINRRNVYPADLRDVLIRSFALRRAADYGREFVTEPQASRMVRRAAVFVGAIQASESEKP